MNELEHNNYLFRYIIPLEFWGKSGVDYYEFKTYEPSCRPHSLLWEQDGLIRKIEISAYCGIIIGKDIFHFLISEKCSKDIFDAILFLGTARIRARGDRIQKYMNLYKAYECICDARKIEFSSIRHCLSHSEKSLSRRSVVKCLEGLFDSKTIDLSKYKHLRVFYEYLGKLLIEVDTILAAHIIKNASKWKMIESQKEIVNPYMVDVSKLQVK